MHLLIPLCAAVLTAFVAIGVRAQAYPVKPIRLVLGFPAGTNVDLLARPLAQRMSEMLGQQVIVDNRPGATGLIANEYAAKAAPDGYTLLAAPGSSITSTPHDIIARLDATIAKILGTPQIRALWASQGMAVAGGTPEQFAQRVRDDYAKYGRIVRAVGIKPE